MMKATVFLDELKAITKELTEQCGQLLLIDHNLLNVRPERNKWSIAECFEHLNLTLEIYLPQIQEILKQPEKYPRKNETFKHGWMGGFAVKAMQPKADDRLTFKMKTFARLNPSPAENDAASKVKKFNDWQEQTLEVLNKVEDIDLKKPKINTAVGSILKMGVGDALHFVIAHNQRHVLQAQKVLQKIQ